MIAPYVQQPPGLEILHLSLIIVLKGGTIKVIMSLEPCQITGLLVEYAPVMEKAVARVSTARGFINFVYKVEGTKVVSVETRSSIVS